MNRQHRFQLKAIAQQAVAVNRMFTEYERETVRECHSSRRDAHVSAPRLRRLRCRR